MKGKYVGEVFQQNGLGESEQSKGRMRCGNADQLLERLGVEGIEKRTDNGIYIVMRG